MKKNVILSTVAATVVTGVLMLSGCGSNSTAPEYSEDHKAVGETKLIVVDSNGKVTQGGTVKVAGDDSKTNLGGGYSNTKVTLSTVKDCKDASGKSAECSTVCTPATPCEVKVVTACATKPTLDFTKSSDFIGAFSEFNKSGHPAVVTARGDATVVPTFSGVINLTASSNIGKCGFEVDTFIVCALTKDGVHAWNSKYASGGNSKGYVLVLAEYDDGRKVWEPVQISWETNADGTTGQARIKANFDGKAPVKITVMSILEKGRAATGATGSTGASIL